MSLFEEGEIEQLDMVSEEDGAIWVDPKTGEIVDEGTEGSFRLDAADFQPEVTRENPDAEWLGDYVTRRLVELEAQELAAKLQSKKIMVRIKAERRQLARHYEERLKRVVKDQLVTSKKKSVSFAYGTAGFRTSNKVTVTDEAAAIAWAQKNSKKAVKISVSLLKSNLPKGKEVPGVERKKEQTWFMRGA